MSHSPTEREQAFCSSIEDQKYNRGVVAGLRSFARHGRSEEVLRLYSPDELKALSELSGTERDIESRMPVKATRHFLELARLSKPLQHIVKARKEETEDMLGADDPGNQLDFAPVEGLLHKYEMALLYVVTTCSAHCRFCYREELIARKEVRRSDGSVAPKQTAKIDEVVAYIREHNAVVEKNGCSHPSTGRGKLREVLLSGGDPMVLSNGKLGAWFAALAEAGIECIRLGTKELSFYPDRFDSTFFSMLDRFHETYPHVHFRLMTHFNHPDEFLLRKSEDAYELDNDGSPAWYPSTLRAVNALRSRLWITIENQTPIIGNVNDSVDALRLLQRSLYAKGVGNHYFFCGRNIVAYKAFNVPIERAWKLLNESQKGLSGVESHARLSLVHYKGKTEVVAVTDGPLAGVPGTEQGVVIFKVLRSALDASGRGKTTMVARNPSALWFDDYEDQVICDEAGLFNYRRLA